MATLSSAWTSEKSKRNDLIVILRGCSCPVVLRPQGKCYEFVSSVYIEGVTEGSEVIKISDGLYPLESFGFV
jgi:hypothetical protein